MTLINNVKWVTLSQVVKIFCQVLGMFVFSRLLSPAEIGVMAMALVVVNFTNIFRDLGTSAAVIQQENLSEQLKQSVFTLNIMLGLGVFVVVLIASPYIASFFHQPKLTSVLSILAFSFPIVSSTAIHLSLLERESRFNKIAIIEISSSVTALLIAIVLAYNGAGVYSIVAQTVIYALLSAFGFYKASSWRISIHFDFAEIKKILSFTLNLLSFNLLNFFSRNMDQIIIGRNFSAAILGHYSLAYRLMLFPLQNITFVLTRSLYPILSRLQGNKGEAFYVYMQSIKAIAVIIPPLMAGLAFVSYDFIYIFFGVEWLPVSSILIWLAPVAIMQSLVSTTGAVFMSQGKTNVLLLISIYNAILQIGAFIIGGFFNITTLIQLYFLANIMMFLPNMYLAVRLLSGSFFVFVKLLIGPFFATSAMVFSLIFREHYLPLPETEHLKNFIVSVILGGLVYLIVIFFFERDFVLKKIRR